MFISDMLNNDKVTVSFEVFPPKADSSFDVVKTAVGDLNGLHPDYMSVTYGAGGSTGLKMYWLLEAIFRKVEYCLQEWNITMHGSLWKILKRKAAFVSEPHAILRVMLSA